MIFLLYFFLYSCFPLTSIDHISKSGKMLFNITEFFYHFFYCIDSSCGDNYFNHLYI